MKKYFATILVVDNDDNDRVLIERALRAASVVSPIYLASDGAEAIAYFMGEGKCHRSCLVHTGSIRGGRMS